MTEKDTYKREQETEIDLLQILRALLKRIWLLIAVAILFAVLGFFITLIFVEPKYSATFTAYINNHNTLEQLTSVSNADLSARSNLATTAASIADSYTVRNTVAEESGLELNDLKVSTNIDTGSGILTVRVILPERDKTLLCARNMASTLKEETERVIEGSSFQEIDRPRDQIGRYSPSYMGNAVKAGLIGLVLAAIFVIILELTDDTLKDASELEKKYGVPIVGTIPDIASADRKGKYYKYAGNYAYSSNTNSK